MKIFNLRHKGMTQTQPGKKKRETVEETDRGENCFGENTKRKYTNKKSKITSN